MFSIWWMLLAFVVGGYAGAIAVALMTMAARQDRIASQAPVAHRADPCWRRRHGTLGQY